MKEKNNLECWNNEALIYRVIERLSNFRHVDGDLENSGT